jgi:hypothetical protein
MTASVFLVNIETDDFEAFEIEAAFASRDDALDYALDYALCLQAHQIETFNDVLLNLIVDEYRGAERVSRIRVEPRAGRRAGGVYSAEVVDRDAVYRDLARVFSV